ncbi:acyltransferase family protein [Leeia aquatica]|uniref:Acyltransferase n=1 Tax=Leeia aquatica TaxID=2725557 RepID=A0A847S3X0_9NEIS|nr:acyltransferase [Leeia aquatica]NLR74493.1 acyltransferase [Leeia aquatica]
MDKMKTNHQFAALNGLRFFAFGWVFIGHLPQTLNSSWIRHMQFTNWVGVQVFFVLSAFLVTYLAMSEIDKTGNFSVGNFFARRALRLLPLYFVVAAIGFVIFPFIGVGIGPLYVQGEEYFRFLSAIPFYLTFVSNFSSALFDIDWGGVGGVIGPLWSITVEIQFYAAFSISFVLFTMLCKKIDFHRNVWFPFVVIILFFWFSGILKVSAFNIYGPLFVYVNLIGGIDSFFLGALLAWLYRSEKGRSFLLFAGRNVPLQGLIAICGYGIYNKLYHLPHATAATTGNESALVFSLSAALSCIIVFTVLSIETCAQFSLNKLAITTKYLSNILCNKCVTKLGEVSYGLYVFHTTIIYFLANQILKHLPNGYFGYALMCTICIMATAALAQVSYNLFESRFIIMSARFKS